MGSKAGPPPPDYQALAKAQGTENKEAAKFNTELNRVNQFTPYGSLTWTNKPTFDEAGYNAAVEKSKNAEALYLSQNPDVAKAIRDGKIRSAADHYAEYGRKEGREGYFATPDRNDFMKEGWAQTMTLDPAQQKLLDQQNAMSAQYGDVAMAGMSRVGEAMAKPFDTSGAPALQGAPQAGQMVGASDPSQFKSSLLDLDKLGTGVPAATMQAGVVGAPGGIARDFDTSGVRKLPGQIDDASRRRVEEALMARINPQYQQDEQALRTRLLNSGIEVGTDAYNREMNNFSQRLNDARMQAVLAGGSEESRQVGLQASLQGQEFGQAQAKGVFGQNADVAMASNGLQQGIANANMQQQASMFNAQSAQQAARDRIANMLAGQGLNLQANSQNYSQDMTGREFDNKVQSMEYQQGLAGAQFGNQARSQALQEEAWLRQLPLNEVNALRSGSQVQGPQFQSYYTGGNAAGAPIFDAGMAQGQAAMAQQQAKQNGTNAVLSTAAQLAAAYFTGGASLAVTGGLAAAGKQPSDIRLKTNIQRIGNHPAGVGRYSWDWLDGSGSSHGVIAQELQAVRPDAVITGADGMLSVDYDMIGGQ